MIDLVQARREMVDAQLRRRGVVDRRVIEVMGRLPRESFVAPEYVEQAYDDNPLPIGSGQTISQPFMVARMTELLELKSDSVALEVGSGCGYQTAVLAELCAEVYSIELVYELMAGARERLREMGYQHVHIRQGDGALGWPEKAPFDAISLAAAAASEPPSELLSQLARGGRMVAPLGRRSQKLFLFKNTEDGIVSEELFDVRFVPLINPQA